ncbi:MAG: hypothetical protein KGY49_02035 [Wenzhouxiangellaceae bacterium]|nr:hypothetical protein [Wenzhouxiangellaceae bacterium]
MTAFQSGHARSVTVVDWLTTADGLPNPDVEAIVRDRAGYVWIGTRGGLVRHEGVRLNVLRRDPDRPGSLPGDNILSLMAADDGDVWAAISERGIVRVRGVDVVRHWANERDDGPLRGRYVWSMAEACDGSVWGVYATDGLVRIDPGSGATTHFAPGESGLPDSGFGLQLVVGEDCRMWLLRTDGLWRVEKSSSYAFRRVVAAEDSEFQVFLSLLLTGNDTAFVTGSSGVIRMDLGDGNGAGPEARIVETWDLDGSVNVASPAADGRLWLGMRRGLDLFDPATGESGSVAFGPDQESLDSVQVNDVMPGAEGGVWLSTTGRGIARLPPGWRGFSPIRPRADGVELERVTSVANGPSGSVWLGSANHGVFAFDPETGRTRPTDMQLGFEGREVIGLHVTGDSIWSLTRRLLVLGERDRGESRTLIEHGNTAEDHFKFMAPAGANGIWAAGDSYLLRLDASGEVLERWSSDADPPRRLGTSPLKQIVRGPAGNWWLLAADALYRQTEDGAFEKVYRAESANLVSLAFQGDRLWLAADSALQAFAVGEGGLRAIERYTAGDGLPPGRVQSLVPRAGNLWLLMSVGLARLDTESGKFRLFSAREGLMQSEFNARAVVDLADGRFVAGTNNGLLAVDPAVIQPTPWPPPVHLISVRAGDRRYPLDGARDAPLEFDWRQNSLEFSFLALSYINPAQNRYRIRLTGWEDDWQELQGQTTRFFSNLPSGRYVFEVQAANVDGIWNRTGDRAEFTIAPPPWRSTAAWAVYGLIALALTGTGWRAMVDRRRRRQSLRRASEQQQLADRQRELLARLNRSLEPERLAQTIGQAVLELFKVSHCHVGYIQPDFPGGVRSFGDAAQAVDRARFDAAIAEGGPGEVLQLGEDDRALAAVWLPELDDERRGGLRGRLDLFAQAAGQVLENARLLLDVRKLARRANEASEAKSEFLATMSHEIRTPLHGLLGMMELFEQAESDPGRLDMLDTMRGSGRQLQRILNDVLDLSRIEAGRVELESRPFELVPLLERVVDLHASNAFASGLDLRLRIAADLPVMAIGDADRIAQILGNLVSNAIKFTAAGWVALDARLDENDLLVLSVSDTGPGIAAAVRAELFEPFTQLESVSTRKHSGTGLGLAISRRLVDAMHGRLDLVSEPGEGSCFSLHLPLSGMRRHQPFAPALLRGLRLAAAVAPADREQVVRLAQRWSIELVELDASLPPERAGLDVLIWHEDELDPAFAQDCCAHGLGCWHLGDAVSDAMAAMPRIRAPLTEARLIGALMDFRFSPP